MSDKIVPHFHNDAGVPVIEIGSPGVISDFGACPSGEYIFLERITRPYSYRVPYHRFPAVASILDAAGKEVITIAELPLADRVPTAFDAVRKPSASGTPNTWA